MYTIEFGSSRGDACAFGAIITSSSNVIIKPEPSLVNRIEFFDRHPRLPAVLLVFLPFVLQVPLWLLRRSTDPMWFVSGLNHGALPLPFIDPNVGFTSEALGRLAAWDWLHGITPWWNPYTGIGMPLAGELQPGAFFLPFCLLLRLPGGILWQQIAMQIIAGLCTYALLRELSLSRLAAFMGGALFALNGTFAWTAGPAASYCSLPFLPLLLFGIERARKQAQGALSILIIALTTAWSILAGFPETAYISALLVLCWGLYRFAGIPERWMMSRRAMAGFVLGMLMAAPLLVAFVDYVRQSDSFGIHDVGEQSLPWAAFSATVMPYVYGSLGTTLHSRPLLLIWATIGGYTGALIIVLAVVGVSGKAAHRGLRFILLAWILLAWAKTFGVYPVSALMNHIPLMKQTNFFRFAPPSWELALIILAAFGLDDFLRRTPDRRGPFAVAAALIAIGIALAWPQRAFWERPRAFIPFGFVLMGLSVAWALIGLIAAGLWWKRSPGGHRRFALAALLIFDAAIMFIVPQSASVRGEPLDMPAVQFLAAHLGLSRFYTLNPIQPNYGAYFRVASINHNVEPVPKLWADFVEANLLPGFSKIDSSETFWAGVMPEGEGERALAKNLSNYLNLGVRYVVTSKGQSPMPIVFVPAKSEDRSVTPRLQSLTEFLERLSSISENRQESAVERIVAKTMLRIARSMLGHTASPDVGNRREAAGIMEANYVTLKTGQSLTIELPAPSPVTGGSPITSVGTIVGKFEAGTDGELAVEICHKSICRSGQRGLAESTANRVFQIPLNQPLVASAGAPLRVSFTRRDGLSPVPLWLAVAAPEQAQPIEGPDGAVSNRSLQLGFEYGGALPGSHKVYADSVMDIWELTNPAPYFQVIQGGPCTLLMMQREELAAECASQATLLRRELYMPGWRVSVNGARAGVQQNDIFQSAVLPAGHSHVRYRFVPPYAGFGWAVSIMGMAGLIWQVAMLARSESAGLFFRRMSVLHHAGSRKLQASS